jgi:predicted AlkP superfamily pyrophosphatase or phosphodiesterase
MVDRKHSLFCGALRVIALLALAASMGLNARAAVEHVIAISVDGLRGDLLQKFLEETPQDFPNFVRLRNSGAATFNARCDYWYSETVPNHVSMVTGRPVFDPVPHTRVGHGITFNQFLGSNITIHAGTGPPRLGFYKASVFDVVHDHGLSTALLLSKTSLDIIRASYGAAAGALDATGVDNGRNKLDFVLNRSAVKQGLIGPLVSRIAAGPEAFTFLHIADPDYAGHVYGWSGEGGPYRNSVKDVDGYLGAIFMALDAQLGLRGKVAIVLTADHGGGEGDSGTWHATPTAPVSYTIPFFITAPGVKAGVDAYSLFENRSNPGQGRPFYTDPLQPLRNGDLANLSLALLGLPSVPDSYMRPELAMKLELTVENGKLKLKWPGYLRGVQLQYSLNLKGEKWQTIARVADSDGNFTFQEDLSPTRRYFRLRRP